MGLKLLIGNGVVEHYVHHVCTLLQLGSLGELK